MKVLVINAGSSSIKYQLFDMPKGRVLAKGSVDRIGDESSKLTQQCGSETTVREEVIADHKVAMQQILDILVDAQVGAIGELSEIATVGHRVVHGGEEFTGSMVVDDRVLASIEKFVDLAPLHNPHNLLGIHAAQENLPNAVQVACFDTAFHTSIPEVAYMYALPYELYEKYRIRRYGFHGTSHRYVARRAATLMGVDKYQFNTITCHLGNGCSMAAVRQGKSVDTSMGFTPLEGLVMGTRTGDFDPAILFYLANKGYDVAQLNALCNRKSGLLGLSGASNDMRTLETLAQEGNRRAKLAIEVFCYRVRKYVGAFLTVLNPLHAIVFTGGIGENSPLVRRLVCQDLDHVGIRLDSQRNENQRDGEITISTADSGVRIMVIPTNEEEAIAQDAFDLGAGATKSA